MAEGCGSTAGKNGGGSIHCRVHQRDLQEDQTEKEELEFNKIGFNVTKEKTDDMFKELQGQEQLGAIITKEKADESKLLEQEHINVINMKLPKVEKVGKVSKQLDKTGFSVNKEKSSEAREFEKISNLEGKIWEEKKPPDENIFVANKEKKGKLDMFGKFTKIDSKGVTKACVTKARITEACVTKACVTEACVTKACIVTESEGDTRS